jgi:hypothetical protein
MIGTIQGLGCRFDWYQCTLDAAEADRITVHLTMALGATRSIGKGRNGYARNDVIERDGHVLIEVFSASARHGEVHLQITGESCDEVVPLVRSLWPEHRVARADSSVDFLADFDELDARTVAFAEKAGLSHELHLNSAGGATRYVGARSSEVRLRVYKKSEQLRILHPERASMIPDGVVRAELETRPGKRDVKAAVAGMQADDVWGLSRWSRSYAADLLDFDAPRTATHFRRPTSWGRSSHFLGQQWGPVVQQRALEVGLERARREVLELLGLGG